MHMAFLCLQAFDLNMQLDEAIQQMQNSNPRRRGLDEPEEVLTFDEFSKLFQ